MSGFDTSQPITDEKALQVVDTKGAEPQSATTDAEKLTESAQSDELGDATPGPR